MRADAFASQVLTEKHMLTAAEEWELVQQLHFAPEDAWLQTMYKCVCAIPTLCVHVPVSAHAVTTH